MKKRIVLTTLLSAILAGPAMAGHHESLMPPAKAGQIVVAYQGACPAEAVDGAVAKIRETIAYERANSPVGLRVFSRCLGRWQDWRRGFT